MITDSLSHLLSINEESPKNSVRVNGEPKPDFESLPNRSRHERFLRQALDLILEKAVFDSTDRKNRVVEWTPPEALTNIVDLEPKLDPLSHKDLLSTISNVIKYSVKTGHPYFVNQLFSSVDPYGLVGQWLTDALNPSVYTYEVSPVFTLMEEAVLKEMRRIVGFSNGHGDGVFCPGGSVSNGYAISCARFYRFPDVKAKGLISLPRLILFTSEDAHYSTVKMASFMGMGSDNVWKVKTDLSGKMSTEDLGQLVNKAIKEGHVPFMVTATAGTTVLGAFDPITKIANICKANDMWLHVDAAWGGGALMSKTHKHLLKGIERADSVTWNPHKLLSAPQQCSVFLTRHKQILAEAHSSSAEYLFQKDKFYDMQFDTGDKHIQCGRRADVLKFWMMWKAKGTRGFEEHIDKVFDNADFFLSTIKRRPGFELVLAEPECTNICFWYIPPSLRSSRKDPAYKQRLHLIAPRIKERMMKAGTMMVTYQPKGDLPNFFRIVFQNSGLEHSDMTYFLNEIERLGSDL